MGEWAIEFSFPWSNAGYKWQIYAENLAGTSFLMLSPSYTNFQPEGQPFLLMNHTDGVIADEESLTLVNVSVP
jgi:hypothetical protein